MKQEQAILLLYSAAVAAAVGYFSFLAYESYTRSKSYREQFLFYSELRSGKVPINQVLVSAGGTEEKE